MFHWLVEGWLSIYLVLLTIAIGLLAMWWRTRRRRWLIGLAVVAGLVGLYALLDWLIETPYEQMVRKINEMAASAQKRDPTSLSANISNDFSFRGMSKDALLAAANSRIRNGDVREVVVWDFQRGPISAEERTGDIDFLIKVKTVWTPDAVFYRCHATFALDPDGQWRLRTFKLFDPTRINEEVEVTF
jgi:hypothetical protein